ncbi:hypothetical protein PC121_g16756, partial [Phytophthora cactorum]
MMLVSRSSARALLRSKARTPVLPSGFHVNRVAGEARCLPVLVSRLSHGETVRNTSTIDSRHWIPINNRITARGARYFSSEASKDGETNGEEELLEDKQLMEARKRYRFTRHNFQPLQTKPLHFDMTFDMTEEKVKVTLQTTLKHLGEQPLSELKLNSKELEILSVEQFDKFAPLDGKKDFVAHVQSFAEPRNLEFEVDKEDHFLVIKFTKPVQSGEEFVIRTVSVATPTENILEGLYFDYTPEGAPKTVIT